MKTLTLILPCYNEEASLPPLFERLAALKRAFGEQVVLDFLFVDDGSKDRTNELLREIPAELQPARLVTHEVNRGLGGAIATGFLEARGQFVAIMDVDCTYDPLYLVDMLPMMQPGIDVVTGSEFHPKGKVENITWLRLFLSRNLSTLYRIAFWSDLYSFSCLLRIYRREILKNILPTSRGFLSCTEVLINAHRRGYKIVEFPLVLTERQHGESKMPIVRSIVDHCVFIASSLLKPGSRRAAAPEVVS
ncbi:MAG TPA: glycosyltransferase [Phycisphaerae bacterium]|nr:glycosyltransferase [Phycisphaerae bacterium]